MDQTTAHPATAAAEPTPVLPALYELIAERAAPERRDALTAFAKAYLRRLTDDDLAEYSLDSLYALVASTFAFTDTRGSRPSIVRVFDPTLEDDGYRAPGSVIETNTDDSPFLVDSVQEELVARNLGDPPPAAPGDRDEPRRRGTDRAGDVRPRREPP